MHKRIFYGLIAGAVIAWVDNYTMGGEVTPIVIVFLLLIAAAFAGVIWKYRCWSASILIWIFNPLVHFIKHYFGWQDTIQPNTYPSILKLAIFTAVITAIGSFAGIFIRISSGSKKGTS